MEGKKGNGMYGAPIVCRTHDMRTLTVSPWGRESWPHFTDEKTVLTWIKELAEGPTVRQRGSQDSKSG